MPNKATYLSRLKTSVGNPYKVILEYWIIFQLKWLHNK